MSAKSWTAPVLWRFADNREKQCHVGLRSYFEISPGKDGRNSWVRTVALTQVISATLYGQATLLFRRTNAPVAASNRPMIPIPVGPSNGTSASA